MNELTTAAPLQATADAVRAEGTSSIGYWHGRPAEELTREELLEVIRSLGVQIKLEREMHETTLALLTTISGSRSG